VRYPVDSLQIYFPCSLELQEELIRYGFQVPASKDKRIKTPIPIIYCNFRGWVIKPEPVTEERLIPPEWYGKTVKELNWKYLGEQTVKRGKRVQKRRAYELPIEEVYVDIDVDNEGYIHFKLDIRGYHLERTSIRGVNPGKWNNWVMFYLDAKYVNELVDELGKEADKEITLYPKMEIQQKGKEKTYYASPKKEKTIGFPVKDFSLCLGCFPLALDYFRQKASETGLNPEIVNDLKLRLEYDPTVNVGLKVGIAKIVGKRPQIMFKLASDSPIKVRGILKSEITGKARGKLVYCDHKIKRQEIVTDVNYVYSALLATRDKLNNLLT